MFSFQGAEIRISCKIWSGGAAAFPASHSAMPGNAHKKMLYAFLLHTAFFCARADGDSVCRRRAAGCEVIRVDR